MLTVVNGQLTYVTQGDEVMFNNPTIKQVITDPGKVSEDLAAEASTRGEFDTSIAETVNGILNIKKEYVSKLTQVGTDAPTALIAKDTITGIVLSRTAAGTFLMTKAGAFLAGKTFPDKKEICYDAAGNLITIERTSEDVLTINTFAAADTSILADGILTNQTIIIEIYA